MPASANRETAAASDARTLSASSREFPVVRIPAVLYMSLWPIGMPSSGPFGPLLMIRASAARVSSSARSSVTSRKLRSCTSTRAMRSRQAR